jgi:hypothetical protein
MAHFYGLALPFLKRGIPITPVQLENVTLPGFLDGQRVLFLSYRGQKPMSGDVHPALADWVRKGGVLAVVDDDKDPYNRVREWWDEDGKTGQIPRRNLFEALGVKDDDFTGDAPQKVAVGKGAVMWVREDPVKFALSAEADARLVEVGKAAAKLAGEEWKETNYLLLRRGPYLIGAGLDESIAAEPKTIRGRFINLFDPALKMQTSVVLTPGSRVLLLDIDAVKPGKPKLLASACRALPEKSDDASTSWTIEGVGDTPAVLLVSAAKAPSAVRLEGKPLDSYEYDSDRGLLYIRLSNEAHPRELRIDF